METNKLFSYIFMPSFVLWFSYRALNIPSVCFYTLVHKTRFSSIYIAPLFKTFRSTFYFNKKHSRAVSSLSLLVSPSTVTRTIVAVVINPIYAVATTRFFTHIYKKVTKTIFTQPSIADFNTTPTVSMVGSVIFAITSVLHGSIRVIFIFIFATKTAMPIVSCIFTNHKLVSALKTTPINVRFISEKSLVTNTTNETRHMKYYKAISLYYTRTIYE